MITSYTQQQAVFWLFSPAPHLAVVFVRLDDCLLPFAAPFSQASQVQAGPLSMLPTCNVTPAAGDLLAEADESADVCCVQCHEE